MNDALSAPLFRRIGRIADEKGLRAFVIGGYVRDHFLHRPCTDIDIVVVGSGIEVAEALGRELKTKVSVFKNFGTAHNSVSTSKTRRSRRSAATANGSKSSRRSASSPK